MTRAALMLLSLLAVACRTTSPAEHLLREQSYLVPFVDIDEEAHAVRGVLAQRKLVIEEEVKRPSFIALYAASLDGVRSAVRIISSRGVVVAEDADREDWFSPSQVALQLIAAVGSESETLLGVQITQRNRAAGCLSLYRIQPDGRASLINFDVDRFGSRACVSSLRSEGRAPLTGTVSWPSLSPFEAPSIEVELRFAEERLDRPDLQRRTLRVVHDGDWLQRETARVAEPLPGDAPFSVRHARAVERAVLSLSRGESVEQQLVAYQSTLGRVLPGSPEAEIADVTAEHIRAGWLDEVEQTAPPPADDESAAPAPDDTVVEPAP